MTSKRILLIVLCLLIATPCFAKARWYNAIALTGGEDGHLDSINGQNLSDGDRAIVLTATAVYFYYLDYDSGSAESSPDVISPDNNADDKRWILIQSITP